MRIPIKIKELIGKPFCVSGTYDMNAMLADYGTRLKAAVQEAYPKFEVNLTFDSEISFVELTKTKETKQEVLNLLDPRDREIASVRMHTVNMIVERVFKETDFDKFYIEEDS